MCDKESERARAHTHLCAWVETQRRLNSYGNAADILFNVRCLRMKKNATHHTTQLHTHIKCADRLRNARVAVLELIFQLIFILDHACRLKLQTMKHILHCLLNRISIYSTLYLSITLSVGFLLLCAFIWP